VLNQKKFEFTKERAHPTKALLAEMYALSSGSRIRHTASPS
jgi:hypothetical protein